MKILLCQEFAVFFLLSLLRDMRIRPDIPQCQTYNTYLTELRQRTINGCQFSRQSLAKAGENQREYCNRGRKLPTLKPNDEVVILLPEK